MPVSDFLSFHFLSSFPFSLIFIISLLFSCMSFPYSPTSHDHLRANRFCPPTTTPNITTISRPHQAIYLPTIRQHHLSSESVFTIFPPVFSSDLPFSYLPYPLNRRF
ncbi:hypothetical protein QBC45DRAFT_427555 [Copromyces sp. CBS 386.78]|nr:hypothetical protein QBC45DRAFT_427555 [Copromyces sp. CBS 386.78]